MNSLSVMPSTITPRLSVVNNHVGIMRKINPCSNSRVDVYAIRQKNLAALVNTLFDGNQARLGTAIGVKQPQVNRWLSNSTASPRKISESSARQIEIKLGLPKGGLDETGGVALRPIQRKAIDDFFWIMENGEEKEKSILLATVDAIKSAYKEDSSTTTRTVKAGKNKTVYFGEDRRGKEKKSG